MKKRDHDLEKTIRENYDIIYIYCRRRIQNEQDARDVTQEVFEAFIKSFDSLSLEKSTAWLYSCAHNKIVDFYKKERREKENRDFAEFSEETAGLFYEMEEDVSEEKIEVMKETVLNLLTPKEIIIYNEFIAKNTKIKGAGHLYGMSDDALYKRVVRLRDKILQITKQVLRDM